ncbi:hypothetical protein FDP41_003799 [Naegleria fowleri]|uniref:Uncharacterized protein n=1 Tax=Naegleria fowleri TaxID=5763 RepID=A0A6A5BQ28_NAEFO|nr:uncharacterized protein FDP41_003799 [Naegleria fowleri]KAF0977146.1 hypothetical protein FDP41_003799 [Naegleria fowleri]
METRDVKFMFNYVSKVAKYLNLRPEIVASRGIKFNEIPSMVEQLQSREENIEDAKHLNYLKESLYIYELPIFNHEDILAGKHKNITEEGNDENDEEVHPNQDQSNQESAPEASNDSGSEVLNQKDEETVETSEEPSEKQKDKKVKSKDKKKSSTKNDSNATSKKKEKSKGIQKQEKMKEKLHKKK